MITYFIENETPEDLYVFDFIFNTLKIKVSSTNSLDDADICYLDKATIRHDISSKIIIKRNTGHIIWNDLIDDSLDLENIAETIPFDILNALLFFLKDEGNKGLDSSCFDLHKRLKYKQSFQFKNGIGTIPIVNKYIIFLKQLIEKNFDIALCDFYPNGKKACVILSHDVDNPDKNDTIKNYPILPQDISFSSVIRHYKNALGLVKYYFLDKKKDEYWCFDKIIEAEKKFGFKSTSYFSAINNHHNYASKVLDVPYNIKHRKFQSVFKKMKDNTFEIGVHASYNAYKNQSHFDYEKNRLESSAKVKIIGLRHHYWHLGEEPMETMVKHEKAGFLYDSSLAFNDHLGFRYSAGLPFYPYHSGLKRKIDVLQIPVFCMDGNLFYDESMTTAKAVNEVSKYIDIIELNQGVGAIDWHTRTSYPTGSKYNDWGEAYLQILEKLSEKKDIWVTSASDFYEWWHKRTLT